ncbi:MAG: sensor histidine kinase, partial [Planctomycetota bacterium]
MLPIEYIGFLINIVNTNDFNELISKVKNTLSIILNCRVEFSQVENPRNSQNAVTKKKEELSIVEKNSGQLNLSIPITCNNNVLGYFNATFSDNILTNAKYNFLLFLTELVNIQLSRIELNKELVEHRKSLDTILESLNVGILVTDSNLVVQKFNQNFLIMFDIDENINGMSLKNFLREDVLVYFLDLKIELENQNFAIEKVFDFTFFNGRSVKYALSINAFTYETVKNYIYMARDLTYTKEIERLKSLDIQKNTFLAHISHELKTPLTAIMGYIELLVEHETDMYKKEFLNNIYSVSEGMLQLVQNLLTITKIESGNLKLNIVQFNLIEIINKIIELFKTSQKHRFNLLSSSQEINIWADKEKIREIFINLISNAVKYSPEGGAITIGVKSDEGGKCVEVFVQDEGIGIPHELLPYIFEKFYRVENPVTAKIQGTGLGLYIVKSLVELHKGKISVRSYPNKGTTFTIILPVKRSL